MSEEITADHVLRAKERLMQLAAESNAREAAGQDLQLELVARFLVFGIEADRLLVARALLQNLIGLDEHEATAEIFMRGIKAVLDELMDALSAGARVTPEPRPAALVH